MRDELRNSASDFPEYLRSSLSLSRSRFAGSVVSFALSLSLSISVSLSLSYLSSRSCASIGVLLRDSSDFSVHSARQRFALVLAMSGGL